MTRHPIRGCDCCLRSSPVRLGRDLALLRLALATPLLLPCVVTPSLRFRARCCYSLSWPFQHGRGHVSSRLPWLETMWYPFMLNPRPIWYRCCCLRSFLAVVACPTWPPWPPCLWCCALHPAQSRRCYWLPATVLAVTLCHLAQLKILTISDLYWLCPRWAMSWSGSFRF